MPEPVAPFEIAELPEFDVAERVRGECRATGLWFSGHPLDHWIDRGALGATVPACDLGRHVGRRVAIVGLPCAWRRIETKNGGLMSFLSLADQSDVAECVLFPDALRRWAEELHGEVLRAEGRVDETLGVVTLCVEKLSSISGSAGVEMTANTPETEHDFFIDSRPGRA